MIPSFISLTAFAITMTIMTYALPPLSSSSTDGRPVSQIQPRALAQQFTQQESEIEVPYVDLYVRGGILDNTYISLDTSVITCDILSSDNTFDNNHVFEDVETYTSVSTVHELCGTLAGVYTLDDTQSFKPASSFDFFDHYKQAHGRLSELDQYWVCLMWDADEALGFFSHTMPIEKCPILLQLGTTMNAYHTQERIFFDMRQPFIDASELIIVPFVFPYELEENGDRFYSYSVLDFTDVYENIVEYDQARNMNRGAWQMVLVTKTMHQHTYHQNQNQNSPSVITISSSSDDL